MHDVTDLAAGVATGAERASALCHVDTCTGCRRELESLAAIVDELLTLVPPVPPSAGFHESVLRLFR